MFLKQSFRVVLIYNTDVRIEGGQVEFLEVWRFEEGARRQLDGVCEGGKGGKCWEERVSLFSGPGVENVASVGEVFVEVIAF